MTMFARLIGVEKTVNLAVAAPAEAASASVLSSGFDGDRVKSEELEFSYLFDPIVFNSVNKSVQTIMAPGYKVKAGNEKERKKTEAFLNNIGNVGGDTTIEELFGLTFQNQMVFGRHYTEMLFNEKMTKMVDLITLNPRQMDYARDSSNHILLDNFGNPVGYTQEVPYGVDTTGKGDHPPEDVSLGTNKIFLLPERIAHFKLYTFGAGYESIGIVEPAYKSIVRRQKIEEAQTNSIYARGTYPIIDKVGSPEVFPTPKMLQESVDKLAKIQHNRYFAVPYWHDIKPLEVKQSEIVDNTIKMLRENLSASLGMPLAFSTGSGEATNRATLTNQQKFMEYSLNDVVKRTLSYFKKHILKKFAELEKFSQVPEIVWGDIGAEDKSEKANRLAKYTHKAVRILSPEDVRAFARDSEGLDLFPKVKIKDEKEDDKKENQVKKILSKL